VAMPGSEPEGRSADGSRPDGGDWFAPLLGPAGLDASGRPSGPPAAAAETAAAAAAVPPGFGSGAPSSASEAVRVALASLSWLARAEAAAVPVPVLADCLRGLEQVLAVHTAARARILGGFTAQHGYEDDGQGSPRTWLTWQTRITRPAASAAAGWARRLREHPAVAEALARAEISQSWARQICEWTSVLPAEHQADADVILLAAAAGGADLAGLADLAEQIRRRVAAPDKDRCDGFTDRGVRLATTLGGAGRLTGDLSARCAAALRAVLDSLGKKAGPDDIRTIPERDHDALEEALRRLLAAGCLPDRAGQPVQLQLHLTLDQLLGGTGTPGRPWLPPGYGTRPPAGPGTIPVPGSPVPGLPAAGPGDDCDAAVAPIVTGRVDHHLLDQLARRLTTGPWADYDPARPACTSRCAGPHGHGSPGPGGELSRGCARQLILTHATALLSGPSGLASWLRTGTLPPPASSVSLPLDAGAVTDLIPPHLRRAIITRDRHCAAPGCDQPPAACHIHHIIPRSQGGTTSLTNCLLLCSFHHLIMIHRWGWTITLHPDGTTTMTSPHGRALHSHDPPAAA
jgi:Domain of unknown function (DUF222)/HNH endonuclease